MIRDEYQAGRNMRELADEVRQQPYYKELPQLISKYPDQTVALRILLSEPEKLRKYYHVSLSRRIARLRYRLMPKEKGDIIIRGNLIKI